MAQDRILKIGDLLVDEISRYLADKRETFRVERKYAVKVTPATLNAWLAAAITFTVYVIPILDDEAVLTRGEDEGIYRYGIVFLEKYDGQGEPSLAWIDARALLVMEAMRWLKDPRRIFGEDTDGPRTNEARILEPLVDPELLGEDGLFWAEAELEIREVVAA